MLIKDEAALVVKMGWGCDDMAAIVGEMSAIVGGMGAIGEK